MTWTLVEAKSTTASATSTLTGAAGANGGANTPAAGDLLIVIAEGNTTSIATSGSVTLPYTNTGADVNALTTQSSLVQTGSGTVRVRIWYRVLTSNDLASSGGGTQSQISVHMTNWTNSGTARWQYLVVRETAGFAADPYVAAVGHSTNQSPAVVAVSGAARKCIGIAVQATGATTFTWDSDSAKDPYFDESSGTDTDGPNNGSNHFGTGTTACQADWKTYTAAETVDLSSAGGTGNTTHALLVAVFQVQDTSKPLNTASVTAAAQPLGRTKSIALGTATATAAAQPFTVTHEGTLGTATVTTTAQPFTRSKSIALGTAQVAAAAQPLYRTRILALGTADVDTAAGPATVTKSSTFEVGLSTPAAGTYATRILHVRAHLQNATDQAELQIALLQGTTPVTTSGWYTLTATPTEYDLTIVGAITDYTDLNVQVTSRTVSSAVPIVSQIVLELNNTLGIAPVTAAALPFGRTKSIALGTATATVVAQPVTRARSVALGTADVTVDARPLRIVVYRDITYTPGAPTSRWQPGPPASRWQPGEPAA